MRNVVGENLKRLMKMRGISQDQLAKKAKMVQPELSRIANGTLDVKLSKLAEALEVPLEEFVKPLPKTIETPYAALIESMTPEQRDLFAAALEASKKSR